MVTTHGWSCKVKQGELTRLLQAADLLPQGASCEGEIGDDAVVRVIDDNLAIVENVDVFTPIHDDPETQGKIVACNATNDIFAMGAANVVSLQAFLAYPENIPDGILYVHFFNCRISRYS